MGVAGRSGVCHAMSSDTHKPHPDLPRKDSWADKTEMNPALSVSMSNHIRRPSLLKTRGSWLQQMERGLR